jgi:hypothetical protein
MSLGDRTTSIQVMTPADNHQKCARAPGQFRLSGNLLRAIVAVWILLIGSETSWSQTGIMQFTAYPPDAVYEKFMGDHAADIGLATRKKEGCLGNAVWMAFVY